MFLQSVLQQRLTTHDVSHPAFSLTHPQAETNFLNNTEQHPSLKMTDSQLGQFQATNYQRAT